MYMIKLFGGMSMQTLLERVRRIGKLILRSYGDPMDFNETAKIIAEAMKINVYLIDADGKVLGASLADNYECSIMNELLEDDAVLPADIQQKLMDIEETMTNVREENDTCLFKPNVNCTYDYQICTYIPIAIHGERLGTLVLTSMSDPFSEDDLIIAEYGATVAGMEMIRARMEHAGEKEREAASIQLVLRTISYSELIAIEAVLQELNGEEGVITAAKVADQAGITRSVIVNALRKLESAGIINSRSLGMKGTYVKILNNQLIGAIEELSK